ncbi:GNAT family N-acetyltransferase [Achromobacter aloeverae]|uniref:GNAT family N-acetyltransferase n=1 Tax=Achromobacter aloeverae TaxID=1750518 RepID=A0A4Q1HLR6_9BURK|nr:GNAT family N-acetyltransferase [Achromobacter aloeverae]RXN91206.1 GNAT family N-acetyltransferase [Achromobacter aloeverae]
MPHFRLSHLDSDQDIQAGFDVMRELRPHLTDVHAYTAQVHRQARQGYRILAAWQDGQVKALAGYRLQENTLYGRFLYVDDLVASADARRAGLGARLLDALREEAREQDCANFVLDTGLGNALAQRFYFRQGLLAMGMHFRQAL